MDLTSTEEDNLFKGNGPDSTMKAGRVQNSINFKVKESLPLIRKFNRHSELILEGITKTKKIRLHDILKVNLGWCNIKETEFADLEGTTEDLGVQLGSFDSEKYFAKAGNGAMDIVDEHEPVPLSSVRY